MKRYILLLLCTLWACSFYSCSSEDPVLNSHFEEGGGSFNPNAFITNPEIPVGETLIITGHQITISWAGNPYAFEFQFKLMKDGSLLYDWSDWSTTTNTTSYTNLEEGEYIFEVTSRYEAEIVQLTPSTFPFTVTYARPITTIISPSDGEVLDNSTAQINWTLNTGAECSYNFNSTGWTTDWTTITSATFDYLDEGVYSFSIKSRFEPFIEELSPVNINFEIDGVEGPGLRFFPLYKEVSVSSQFTLDIYVEDVEVLTGAEIAFTYDSDYVLFNSAAEGSILLTADNNILIEESQTGSVILTLATYGDNDNGIGITGSGPLVQLNFTAIQHTPSSKEIEISSSSFFIHYSGEQAEIENSFLSLHNATIVIE